ncbi:hypothetical protein [Streptoalloteichus hindustanus]|nr:hypothetical protein [Streptoalloteichus hindustanus]
MREPDWRQPRPTEADVERMWRDLVVRPLPAHPLVVDELLDLLHDRYPSGDTAFTGFALGDHPVLAWHASRNRLPEIGFPARLLHHPAVVEALSSPGFRPSIRDVAFSPVDPFTLPGRIASYVHHGGAYHYPPTDPDRRTEDAIASLELATSVCAALFGMRLTDLVVAYSDRPWSDWFFGTIGDATFVVLDRAARNLWLLCVSDDA